MGYSLLTVAIAGGVAVCLLAVLFVTCCCCGAKKGDEEQLSSTEMEDFQKAQREIALSRQRMRDAHENGKTATPLNTAVTNGNTVKPTNTVVNSMYCAPQAPQAPPRRSGFPAAPQDPDDGMYAVVAEPGDESYGTIDAPGGGKTGYDHEDADGTYGQINAFKGAGPTRSNSHAKVQLGETYTDLGAQGTPCSYLSPCVCASEGAQSTRLRTPYSYRRPCACALMAANVRAPVHWWACRH